MCTFDNCALIGYTNGMRQHTAKAGKTNYLADMSIKETSSVTMNILRKKISF